MTNKSKQFQVHLDPKLDSDISELLQEFPEIGDRSEFARKAFSLYIVAKRRQMINGETICMIKDGLATVQLVGV